MAYLVNALRSNPELAIFLTLAVGFLLGRIRIGSFRLGNVVGTLLAGVIIGQLTIEVPPLVKVVFFDLFLFATGYKVGPQFFRGLSRSALSLAALTVVLCVTSLVTTIAAAKLFGYDAGTAAGLMAGAFTESTVIGTAGDAIGRLPLPEAEKTRLLNNIPVAYAVSYLVGTGFVVWFLSALGPKLLGVDLKAEGRRVEAEIAAAGGGQAATVLGRGGWETRAIRVSDAWDAKAVAAVERAVAPHRLFVRRLRHGGEIADAFEETLLHAGDVVAISGRRTAILASASMLGVEVDDAPLVDCPVLSADVVLTNRRAAERTLADLAEEYGRGIILTALIRGGQEIPVTPATVLNRGDLLRLTGAREDVERAGASLGYLERASSETDVVFVGLGILVGGLVGMLSVTVAHVPLSLTASGGALVMGLVFGWLRAMRPTFGRIPEPALWVFDTIGLAVFIGCVGLAAGPTFVSGLRTTGPSLLLVGFVVAVTPHVTALLFGRYVLGLPPLILLGACAGAGTVTAALRSIQDEAESRLPVLGYTVPYAIGNILLTAWGPVIVILMS